MPQVNEISWLNGFFFIVFTIFLVLLSMSFFSDSKFFTRPIVMLVPTSCLMI